MLSKAVKKGDHVFIVYTKDRSSRACSQKGLWKIEKVGTRYLWVDGNKFEFDGKGAGTANGYELFDNEEAYDRHLQRDRLISKIKQATQSWDFGKELTTENLEAIAELMKVENARHL